MHLREDTLCHLAWETIWSHSLKSFVASWASLRCFLAASSPLFCLLLAWRSYLDGLHSLRLARCSWQWLWLLHTCRCPFACTCWWPSTTCPVVFGTWPWPWPIGAADLRRNPPKNKEFLCVAGQAWLGIPWHVHPCSPWFTICTACTAFVAALGVLGWSQSWDWDCTRLFEQARGTGVGPLASPMHCDILGLSHLYLHFINCNCSSLLGKLCCSTASPHGWLHRADQFFVDCNRLLGQRKSNIVLRTDSWTEDLDFQHVNLVWFRILTYLFYQVISSKSGWRKFQKNHTLGNCLWRFCCVAVYNSLRSKYVLDRSRKQDMHPHLSWVSANIYSVCDWYFINFRADTLIPSVNFSNGTYI